MAAAELDCTVAGEAGTAAGHKAQEEGRHIAGHRVAAGTAGEEEGLDCSHTGA